MTGFFIIWDSPDDPAGNFVHIFARHDVTLEEVEEVLRDPKSRRSISRSTGWPICFGWTSTGKYLAVVYEEISHDPHTVHPLTAFTARPPGG